MDALAGGEQRAGAEHELAKRLRASEKKYHDLVERSLQGIVILAGLPPRIVFANPPCASLTGYRVDELLALSPEQVLAIIHPDDRQSVLAQLTLRLNGAALPETGEARCIRKDKGERWIQYFLDIIDSAGARVIQVTFVDVTERKGAQEALQHAHDELERRVEERTAELAATNALLEREIREHWRAQEALEMEVAERRRAEQEIRQRNDELLALNAIATTISQSVDLDHLLNDTLDMVLKLLDLEQGWVQLADGDGEGQVLTLAAQRGLSPATIEALQSMPAGRAAGLERPMDIDTALPTWDALAGAEFARGVCLPIRSKDRVLGLLGVLSAEVRLVGEQEIGLLLSVSQQLGTAVDNLRLARQVAEIEMLRQLDHLRSELIANVSHEIRTPLGLIEILCTSLLMDDVELEPEVQREFLRGIKEETERLTGIVDNLLNLSRLESGRMRPEGRLTDLGQLARRVLDSMAVQLASHRASLDFPVEPLKGTVDARLIERLLDNLVTNAAKYSPAGSRIVVQGYRERSHIVLRVSDEGIGIPAEEHERIFDRFYRVENEITRKVGGVGLGLAVCRAIVEMHSGRIWVDSRPGQGSVFSVALPAEPEATS